MWQMLWCRSGRNGRCGCNSEKGRCGCNFDIVGVRCKLKHNEGMLCNSPASLAEGEGVRGREEDSAFSRKGGAVGSVIPTCRGVIVCIA